MILGRTRRGRAGLRGVGQGRWRPGTVIVVLEMGDQTQGEARQEAANHNAYRPPADQLTLFQGQNILFLS